MRPSLGDFLAAASRHVDAATDCGEPLPPKAMGAALREAARLLAVMAHFASAFTLDDQTVPPPSLEVPERADWDARTGLRRAAVRMRVAASVLGGNDEDHDYDHPAVARLTAAANCLAAGHDLLQTHFSVGRFGSRHGNSPWAPVITSAPVNYALLTEMVGYAHRIARWAIRLTVAHAQDEALPPPARVAVSRTCQLLRAAEAASWAASQCEHGTADARILLRAIPVNTAPSRHSPGPEETVPGLCVGTNITAERLRYLTRAFASRPHQQVTVTGASRQRIAQGAAITGHCSELILRSLAVPGSHLSNASDAMSALAGAADAAAEAWAGWRAVAHAWDTFATGVSKKLTPAAAEIGDLVLWVGRLAHRDPAWIPARRHGGLPREPAELGGRHDATTSVLTALQYAADALADIAECERESMRSAALSHGVFVPTRLLPADQDVPYRYAPAPRVNIRALLDTYDAAVQASHQAVTALDRLTSATNCSASVLTALRAARSQPMPYLPHGDTVPLWLRGRQPPPGQVESALRDLAISEPALLARASDIDEATRHLIGEATAITQRRPHLAEPQQKRGSGPAPGTRHHPAQAAAKDSPRGRGQQLPAPNAESCPAPNAVRHHVSPVRRQPRSA